MIVMVGAGGLVLCRLPRAPNAVRYRLRYAPSVKSIIVCAQYVKAMFMTPNSYNLAMLYHIHHGLHDEDLPFWMALANRYGDPILELGCGTGRVLTYLIAAGWQVVGLDNDLAMLTTLLQIHRSHSTDQLRGFKPMVTAFHLNCCFGLICLPCNTFSTLESAGRHSSIHW